MNTFAKRAGWTLLIVVVLGLVFATIQHVSKAPAPATDLGDGSVDPTASATASGGQDPYTFKPATQTLMSTTKGGVLIFAVRGACDGTIPSATAISPNAGEAVRPSRPGVLTTLAVEARSKRQFTVVGTDANCKPLQTITADGGVTWTAKPDITIWYQDPIDNKVVHSPTGGSSRPGCTVISLSSINDDIARVACSNGTLYGTGNGGDKWTKLGRLDNIRVIDFVSPNVGYAFAKFQGCAGQEFTTTDGGKTWSAGGCVTGDPAQAISYDGKTLIGIVGSQLYRSENKGKTWGQPQSAATS